MIQQAQQNLQDFSSNGRLKLIQDNALSYLKTLKDNYLDIVASVLTLHNCLNSCSGSRKVSSRLPLLNLSDDVLDALRIGQIAYTKAQALSCQSGNFKMLYRTYFHLLYYIKCLTLF